ncbi:aldehyde dehydrogenase family protein, partial [Rhodococcus wratislaviensis]|uniref:aldehyde dehydrogenase family protein n=1 Tax=Rhodococcus wratislaviensis TaxID=44752 RepID=UPI0012DCC89D
MGPSEVGRLNPDGFHIAPTVSADVNSSMEVAREEIFGPMAGPLWGGANPGQLLNRPITGMATQFGGDLVEESSLVGV